MPFEAEKRTTKLPNMEVAHICAICLAELLPTCGRSFQCLGLYTSVLPEISQPTEKYFPLKWNYKP